MADADPFPGMTGLDGRLPVAENYRRFARGEAAGRSPTYERLAFAVAEDELVLSFLSSLPPERRQPNLLFACARHLLGEPADPESLHDLVERRSAELAGVMQARRTQTNDPARCATLLPALASLPEPLALVEVGASAGLTLLFDHYSYDYDGQLVQGIDPEAPTLRCHLSGPRRPPIPASVPLVAWRAGIDLNPLDVGSEADVAWLNCLLWPGEEGREELLAGAVATARRALPPLYRGDLLDDLEWVTRRAPHGATLVVFHSAVLAYVDLERRQAFGRAVRELGAVWLSNEAPGVLPDVGAGNLTEEVEGSTRMGGGFLLVENGENVLARTDGHGTWLEWLA